MFDILTLVAGLFISTAQAQNITCPTRPLGDVSHACANTEFVNNAFIVNDPTGIITTAPGSTAGTDTTKISADIAQLAAVGGGRLALRYNHQYLFNTSSLLQRGVYIDGSCPVYSQDVGTPPLLCTQFLTVANTTALITQADLTSPLHSVGYERLSINGNKASFAVTALMDLSPINGKFKDSWIAYGSGDCIRHRANAIAAWNDWYSGNTIGGCTIGLDYAGSDSWITTNDFSGNSTNVAIVSTGGGTFSLNQVETATADGLVLRNSAIAAFQIMPIVGNHFSQNALSDIHAQIGSGLTFSLRDPIVGNTFHASSGIKIDASVTDGLVVGDYFSDSASGHDFIFDGATNTGWGIYGTAHTLSTSARFLNLPPDAQVISGGPGGVFNRLGSLILSSTSSAVTTVDTRLGVFGNDTVLGAANVQARFGIARNVATFDSALLIGNNNGNGPFIDVVNGETTTVSSFIARFKHVDILAYNATGIDVYKPLRYAGSSSGTATIQAQAAAGTPTISWPTGSGTVATSATSPLALDATTGAVSCATCSTATAANPTGIVGLTAVNGSAATFMRSDAAPSLSQAIIPTWTGLHTYTNSLLAMLGSSTGKTTFTSDNAGASNFTVHIPAANDTFAMLAATQALTNKDLTGAGNTFPTFNQNTTGSAAKWTTPRNLAGNSVDGSGNVAFANKFIVQGTADSGLSAAQFLGALSTGLMKVTTTTGIISAIVEGTGVETALGNNVSGSGSLCLTTSCVMVTPTIGAATATSVNKVAITPPSSSATITIADGTTLTETSSTSVGKGQYLATATNDNATAGNIGEYTVSSVSSGSAIALTSDTPITMTSISLGGGDWDVSCDGRFSTNTTTSVTSMQTSISTTNNTLDVNTPFAWNAFYSAAFVPGTVNETNAVGPRRMSLAAGPTTVYCVTQATFTVSNMNTWGSLQARRVR